MTKPPSASEAARLARVQRITSMSKGTVISGAELLRKHGLPPSVAELEYGVKYRTKNQSTLFADELSPEDAPESPNSSGMDI